MAVSIEAQAIITAKDQTGPAFEQVTAKLNKLAQAARSVASAPVQSLTQAARVADRIDHIAGRVGGALLGGYAAAKVAQVGASVVATYQKFDDLVRYQRAILGITPEQQKPLIDQAIRMGGNSRYNDLQVIEAQLSLAQRGVKLEFVQPIVEAAKEYGQAMNADLPEAAKTIEGILFSTGKAFADVNSALATAHRVANQAVKLAKIGGFDDEDVQQFFKYAGLAGSTAGLSDETIGTMGALMRRSNIRGDEGGVAVRAVAGRLVAPTKKGLDALAAMGIDYNKYTSLPGGLSADNVGSFMSQRFGHKLSAHGQAAVAAILSNPEIVGNRDEFMRRMFEALSPGFGLGKHGKMRPQDSRELTKAISDYYKYSVGKVDSEGLLRRIIAAHPTLGQINALFGDKQGARIMAFMHDLEKFEEYYEKLKGAPDDFAKKIGDERMGGASGAMQRAHGSYLNLETALGRAWDPEITGFFNAIARLEQAFVELSGGAQREISTVVAATAAFAGVGGALKAMELGLSVTAAALSRVLQPLAIFAGLIEAAKLSKDYGGPDFWKKVDDFTGADRWKGWPLYGGPASGPSSDVSLSPTGAAARSAEVKGSADLNVSVQVEPSSSFISQIISAIRNEINVFGGGEGHGVGTAGSTGRSMPEAMPPR